MNKTSKNLTKQYIAALQCYLSSANEQTLQTAYEFGRKAIARGLGILDMAKLHHEALSAMLGHSALSLTTDRQVRTIEIFFQETLTPFEATHRGFREAYQRLQQLNDTLNHRNQDLVTTNSLLQKEIGQRKRTEAALRISEEHYRLLFEQSRLLQEDLRHLSSQILDIQEKERTRISRELHDVVGQSLTAINVNLAMLKKQTAPGNGLQEKISCLQTMMEETMETVHKFARELRPAMLDDLGLVPALRSYIKLFQQRTGIHIAFNAGLNVEKLDMESKTVIYRVSMECLTNIAKHARATQAIVTIGCQKDVFHLVIKDNGRGFSLASQLKAKKRKRLGLLGMQERVRLVNGDFQLESSRDNGTAVRLQIPLKKQAKRRGRSPDTQCQGLDSPIINQAHH